MTAFFPILETLLKSTFWYRQQLLFRFLSSIVAKRFLSSGSSVLGREKNQREPNPWNTMVEVLKRALQYGQQLLFRFSFISSIVTKRFPFIDGFSFGKRKNSAGAKFCSWRKTHAHATMCERVHYHCTMFKLLVFPQFCAFRVIGA